MINEIYNRSRGRLMNKLTLKTREDFENWYAGYAGYDGYRRHLYEPLHFPCVMIYYEWEDYWSADHIDAEYVYLEDFN